MSDLVVARNCCMTRMLPGEAELVSELTGLPGRAKTVKRFERSNGLDTALYKNYLYLYLLLQNKTLAHHRKVTFWIGNTMNLCVKWENLPSFF